MFVIADDDDDDDEEEQEEETKPLGGDSEQASVTNVGMSIPDITIEPAVEDEEEPAVEHVHKSVSFAAHVDDQPVRFRKHSRVQAEDVAKF